MLAGFRTVVAKTADVFETHHVRVFLRVVFSEGAAPDFGIQIISILVIDLEKPGHVIDTRDEFAAAGKLLLHTQRLQQMFGTDLNTVAESDRFDRCVPLHVSGQNRHGIGIIQ